MYTAINLDVMSTVPAWIVKLVHVELGNVDTPGVGMRQSARTPLEYCSKRIEPGSSFWIKVAAVDDAAAARANVRIDSLDMRFVFMCAPIMSN